MTTFISMIAEFCFFASLVYLIICGLRYVTDGNTQNRPPALKNRGVVFNDDEGSRSISSNTVNPANGLPMIGCLDIEGNTYGTDSSHWNDHLGSSD